MPEFNLLKSVPSIRRSVAARLVNKDVNRAEALKFGQAYFDGPREQGYGGYTYDGRWKAVAATARDRYGLKAGMKVLDIGCAKGFFVHDLMEMVPGLEAVGIDISAYALEHALHSVQAHVQQGSADKLPFADHSFDAVFSINTIHNLDRAGCVAALQEMVRVCKNPGACFVQVDAYRNEAELTLFEAWMLTAQTYCTPDEWYTLFAEARYTGDYFWTILEFDETE
ncbi:methyltransferase domain-containing protein [Kordiimonas pumila]|uniref:Methyltransferase domain-containing protein n=1 Tax=Kordiimonas pumila TaxID=2161677 RepID=A0ABV7DA93_9PROT|nr:methyltransferase domain-containing protein [Kordiimonas pumila]